MAGRDIRVLSSATVPGVTDRRHEEIVAKIAWLTSEAMLARHVVRFSVLSAFLFSACSKKPDDETIRSNLVGVWTWNPRTQLPPNEIKEDTGIYDTPDQQIFQFGATVASDHDRGDFVEYRHVPTNKNMKEDWVVWRRGPWFVFQANVEIQGKLESNFNVLRVSANELRVAGVGFPCKDGCVLRRLDAVPEAAKNGRPF